MLDVQFPDRPLENRVVFVAGATGGLGSASAALLARDGALVVAGYRANRQRAEQLKHTILERFGAEIHLVEGDITNPLDRTRCLETADSIGSGLYGFVCFTGNPARVRFDEATGEQTHASLEENYVAPLLTARDAAKRMMEKGAEGAIVLISSMQAVVAFDSSINYAGGKAALIHAARVMAKQWGGPGGVRVNVVAPGVNRAGMALQSIESGKYDWCLEQKVISRFGRPEDVARVVRLLLEPDNYITGQIITVDGGLTLRRDRS